MQKPLGAVFFTATTATSCGGDGDSFGGEGIEIITLAGSVALTRPWPDLL